MPTDITRRADSLDDESRAMIYEGLNISQIGYLFKMDHRGIVEKLHKGGVKPCGKRGSAAIYDVAECAPHLIKPIYDIEAYIRRMNHADLPKQLTKEFWAGQRSRQEYELKAGHLWPTEKVVEEVGELLKILKMGLLLMNDAVERQTELSDRQREIVKSLTHGTMTDLVKKVQERFVLPETDSVPQDEEAGNDEEL